MPTRWCVTCLVFVVLMQLIVLMIVALAGSLQRIRNIEQSCYSCLMHSNQGQSLQAYQAKLSSELSCSQLLCCCVGFPALHCRGDYQSTSLPLHSHTYGSSVQQQKVPALPTKALLHLLLIVQEMHSACEKCIVVVKVGTTWLTW